MLLNWVGLGVVLAVSAIILSRRMKTLSEIERGFVALADGRPPRPILSRTFGPVGRLARRFDELAPRLQARISLLEQDRQQLRAV
ncbi:sensor histidine kinase, partial [Singulisphaera rosea]